MLTHRRQQMLTEMALAIGRGEPITYAHLARRCGLYDFREARRIVNDLRRIGAV